MSMLSKEMPIVPVGDMEELVGHILTQLDASMIGSGKEATKSLVKQFCWDWYNRLPGYTSILKEGDGNEPPKYVGESLDKQEVVALRATGRHDEMLASDRVQPLVK